VAAAGRLLGFLFGSLAIVGWWTVVLPLGVVIVVLYICKLIPLVGRRGRE
jgi:hypothetical protein